MKRLLSAILLVVFLSTPGWSQQKNQQQARRNVIPARMMRDSVLVFYVRQFRPVAGVSDEVFVKILPFLEQFIDDRFQISQRRTRALNQLRAADKQGASEEELKRLYQEVDGADAEIQANQVRFLNNVDPLLNTRQRAKLRIFQQMADNRMRELVNGVQNPAPNRSEAQPDTKKN